MDRRSWLQLMAILTAAQEAQSQQRGGATAPSAEGAGRGGRGESAVPNPPMRVTKQQVIGALILMGLEFQDAELEMMMRGVNQALSSYETLRKADVPIDTEPAFAFHPGPQPKDARNTLAACRKPRYLTSYRTLVALVGSANRFSMRSTADWGDRKSTRLNSSHLG